jgi:hypothetical protein
MDDTDLTLQALGMGAPPSEWFEPGRTVLNQIASAIDALAKIAAAFRRHGAELRDAGELTEFGLKSRLERLAVAELGRIDSLASGPLAAGRREIERLEALIANAAKPGPDDVSRTLRQLWILDRLIELGDIRATEIVAAAAASGEADTVGAALSAPLFIRKTLCLPGELEKIATRYREAKNPLAATALSMTEDAVRGLERAVVAAKRAITSTPGVGNIGANDDVADLVKRARQQ